MGWCSATDIFDAVASTLLDGDEINKEETLRVVISALEDGDWDCQGESAYIEHPTVRAIFKERYPEWDRFKEDDDS